MIQTLMAFIQSWPWLVDLNFITGKFTARENLQEEKTRDDEHRLLVDLADLLSGDTKRKIPSSIT